MLLYLLPFLSSFFLTIFLMVVFILLAKKIKCEGRKSKRHIHREGIYRVGGLAMGVAFIGTILINSHLVMSVELAGFLIASLAVIIMGFWDDIKEIHWKFQLTFQIILTVFVFISGIRILSISNPFSGGSISLESGPLVVLSIILIIFWIVLVMNAMNWLDGIDGLSGGISLISAITIFFLSLKTEVNQPPIAIIASVFMGVILAFLIFNFNPARVLAGTSGSMFMGFVVAILAIFSGTKIATALVVLIIPIIDALWVIWERWKKKKSIFKSDRTHLHYKLLEAGWSQKKICLCYYLFTLSVAIVALNTRAIGKSVTLCLSFLLIVIISILLNKKIIPKKIRKLK